MKGFLVGIAVLLSLALWSCQAPILMTNGDSKSLTLSFSLTNPCHPSLAKTTAAASRLLLPSTTKISVSLTPMDPSFPSVPSQSKAVSPSDTVITMQFPSIRCGDYTVVAQAEAGGVVQFQQTSVVKLTKNQSGSESVTIALVPANIPGLTQLSAGQTVVGNLTKGNSQSWLVPVSTLYSGNLAVILTGTNPLIKCYIQKGNGSLVSGSADGRIFNLFIGEAALITLFNSSDSTTEDYSLVINPHIQYDGNGNTSGSVPFDSTAYAPGNWVRLATNTGNLQKINVGGISYRFAGWNTNAAGTGTSYTEGSEFSYDGPQRLYAKWTPFQVGDTGPAGGLIFYDHGSYTADSTGVAYRYMEVVPGSAATIAAWSTGSFTGSTSIGIGYGRENTANLVNALADKAPAAYFCDNLTLGNCSDWFLPSQDELNQVYLNLQQNSLGGFEASYTWASSASGSNGLMQRFDNGLQGGIVNSHLYQVLAVRSF